MHAHTYTYSHMHAHMHTHMHTRTDAHTCTHTHTRRQRSARVTSGQARLRTAGRGDVSLALVSVPPPRTTGGSTTVCGWRLRGQKPLAELRPLPLGAGTPCTGHSELQ